MRELLLLVRLLFLPWMELKDLFGGRDWKRRRQFTEIFTISKAMVPLLILMFGVWDWHLLLVPGLVLYNMCDTFTYLLVLIVMSDIQRPSANLIRSILMLFINYIEVALDMAAVYVWYYKGQVNVWDAIVYGILGEQLTIPSTVTVNYAFLFLNAGIKFFFITLVFGYFANHMRQRKFKS